MSETAKEPVIAAVRFPGGQGAFFVNALALKLTGVAAYLAFVAGLAALCANLSRHVGLQAVALAVPHVVRDGERLPTLVERRQLEAGAPVEVSHPAISEVPSVLEVPGISARDLALRIDRAEERDLATLDLRAVRPVRSRASRGVRPARVAAADVFGRSFGVMLMASR